MAITYSTAVRNSLVDVFDWANSGEVRLYTGSQPADPTSAPAGTLVATINVPATAFNAPSSGAVTKAGTWSGTVAATATPAFFILIDSGGTNAMMGTVSAPSGGGDMEIDNGSGAAALTSGDTVTVSAFTLTAPGA